MTLNVDIEPIWSEIDALGHRARTYLEAQGLERHTVDALTMVLRELAENATKYGVFDGGGRIAVSLQVTPRDVVIEVRNPVGEGNDEHLRRLDRMIQRIRGYQDPFEVYFDRLREVSGQRLDSRESGLGLVRIAYEGQSVLDFYVDDHDTLAVSAMFRRPGKDDHAN